MKLATIGGGSTYTPELAQGLLERCGRLGMREWWLADIDTKRLEVVGGFVRRMVGVKGDPFRIHLTRDRRTALEGADFVITQIRVGGMQARNEDESLGRRWGLIGQETTGIGGMACALRTVPVLLSLAEEMQSLCPEAWLINFTNPSGLIVEALQRFAPQIRSVGLCNGPIGYQLLAAGVLGLRSPFEVHLDYLGLNHLAWIQGARAGNRDVWPEAFGVKDPAESDDVLMRLGVVCNDYLKYYYRTESMLREQAGSRATRAQEVMEIERKLLARYADETLDTLPPELMQRGGALYSTAAAQLIEAMVLDRGEEHIVNTRQGDAVPGIPPDWVMELPCRIDRKGIHPLPARPVPDYAEGLLRSVKAYEILTVRAACTGDRKAALSALIAHPLGPDVDRAPEVLEDLLETNRRYLPAFF
jgi:6-phospho-beta-glucosidase